MIKDDGTVIHFNNPKVQASLSANTFAITGHAETKQLTEMLPGILSQLGADSLSSLRKLAEQFPRQGGCTWIKSVEGEDLWPQHGTICIHMQHYHQCHRNIMTSVASLKMFQHFLYTRFYFSSHPEFRDAGLIIRLTECIPVDLFYKKTLQFMGGFPWFWMACWLKRDGQHEPAQPSLRSIF